MARIAIASGKGGTGKTLVATNLAAVAGNALLADLDVEEPNCNLFYQCVERSREIVNRKVPFVRKDECTVCGVCAKVCEFHAIARLPKEVLVFDELCHGCGACSRFCPEEAIDERDHPVGEIVRADAAGLRGLVYGRLNIGEASASILVKNVKKEIPEQGLTIIDCPPGTACPAVESMRGSDLCVLVTEPTLFGFHDLKLALAVTKKLRIPSAVLINKKGLPGPDIEGFCQDKRIPIIGHVPFEREIAETYSRGRLLVSEARHERAFRFLLSRLSEEVERL